MRIARTHVPVLATAAVLAAAFAFGAASFPNFASWGVVRNLLVDNAFLGAAAIGATVVIISGGIDLSVGSVMAFTSILVAALVERHGVHPLLAFAAALAVGTAFGAGQGAIIEIFRLPPFLVTLAGLFLARGAAFMVHPQSLGIRHVFVAETVNRVLSFRLPLGPRGVTVPISVPVMLAAFALAWIVLRHVRFGRAVHAIGDDRAAAALMGVPVVRTSVAVYALAGACSALAGILFALYQQSGDPAACKGLELDAIAAVVIGGTLLTGGQGSVIGTFLGVLVLGTIQTLVVFQGDLSSWWTRIAIGALLLAFVALQRAIVGAGRRSGRRPAAVVPAS